MPVIASARWFSGVLHLSCYMTCVAGTAMLAVGFSTPGTHQITGQEPFLRATPSRHSISVVPRWTQTQSRSPASKQTVKFASGQSCCRGYQGSPAWSWPSQDRGWGWRGRVMPGMSPGNAAEVTLQSGYRHMPLVPAPKLLDDGLSQSLGNAPWAMTCTHCISILLSIRQIQ